jgi:hypothetical protein
LKDQKWVQEYPIKFINEYKDKDPNTSDDDWTNAMVAKRTRLRGQVKAFKYLVVEAVGFDFVAPAIEKNEKLLKSLGALPENDPSVTDPSATDPSATDPSGTPTPQRGPCASQRTTPLSQEQMRHTLSLHKDLLEKAKFIEENKADSDSVTLHQVSQASKDCISHVS